MLANGIATVLPWAWLTSGVKPQRINKLALSSGNWTSTDVIREGWPGAGATGKPGVASLWREAGHRTTVTEFGVAPRHCGCQQPASSSPEVGSGLFRSVPFRVAVGVHVVGNALQESANGEAEPACFRTRSEGGQGRGNPRFEVG